jgi:hypothetical protein
LPAAAGSEDHQAGQSKERKRTMPKGVIIPLVVIAAGFVVQFFVQRNVLTRYDYQCPEGDRVALVPRVRRPQGTPPLRRLTAARIIRAAIKCLITGRVG